MGTCSDRIATPKDNSDSEIPILDKQSNSLVWLDLPTRRIRRLELELPVCYALDPVIVELTEKKLILAGGAIEGQS
jgi:hypothetical protein